MTSFKSHFSDKIIQYLEFRESLGFSSNRPRVYLQSFDDFCTENFPAVTKLTSEVVRGWYFNEIRQERLAYTNKASTIRLFAMYCGGDAYILPTDCIPKHPEYVPYILTTEELQSLFAAIDDYHSSIDPFYCETLGVLFRLLYSCGLRPGEARRLLMDDVNLVTGEIFIRASKRNKDRMIVCSDDMRLLLKKYHRRRIVINDSESFFFVNTAGTQLKTDDLIRAIKKCWSAANPNVLKKDLPRLRPYDLRHLYASTILQQWIDEGKNLYAMLPYLRTYMGHKRFEDTAYYIHILPERLMNSPGVNWEYIDSVGLEVTIWKS